MPSPIYYLALSGCGVAGAGYGGAFLQLAEEPEFSFSNLKGVAATSAGAIAALLVALNYTPQEMHDKLMQMDFSKLRDNRFGFRGLFDVSKKYGYYRGDALYRLILSFIQEKFPNRNPAEVTFGDLRKNGFKDLHIYTTKVFKNSPDDDGNFKSKGFKTEKHFDTPLAMIVHVSASPPYILQGRRLKKIRPGRYELHDDDRSFLHVDGGMLNNYPINSFDAPEYIPEWQGEQVEGVRVVNPHVLGITIRSLDYIDDVTKKNPIPLPDGELIAFTSGFIKSIANRFVYANTDLAENRKRTIFCESKIDSFDFNATTEQKKIAVAAGRYGVKSFYAALRGDPKPLPDEGMVDGSKVVTSTSKKHRQCCFSFFYDGDDGVVTRGINPEYQLK